MRRIWRELPITDPLERRQAPVLLMLLVFMFVTSLLRSIFFFNLDQASIGTSLTSLRDSENLNHPLLRTPCILSTRGQHARTHR